jgi:hypothetical protein
VENSGNWVMEQWGRRAVLKEASARLEDEQRQLVMVMLMVESVVEGNQWWERGPLVVDSDRWVVEACGTRAELGDASLGPDGGWRQLALLRCSQKRWHIAWGRSQALPGMA